jgi:tetratricopeptide (TPR) repeat protein
MIKAKGGAVLESFPSSGDNSSLIVEDFSRFSSSFAEILRKHLPTARQVVFAFSVEQAEVCLKENANATIKALLSLFKQIKNGGSSCGILGDYLMLSFETRGGERSVAIISEFDPLFLQRVSEDWLSEIRTTVESEFLLLKQARTDNMTGLLNVSNLYFLLDTYGSTEGFHLILLELPPKRNSFQSFLRNSQRCATLLLNFVQTDSALHSLGQSIFALVLQQTPEGGRLEIESALVNYLKREGCQRVHIGSSFSDPGFVEISDKNEKQQCHGRQLLDEAWTALRHAAKRGPFTFCDFSLLAHPENHPLAPPDRNLVRKLSKLFSLSDTFSLVQFCSDSTDCPASHVISQYIDRGVTISGEDDIFVCLDGAKQEEALEWSKNIISQIDNSGHGIQVSAGVSNYPYYDFKKSETILNCRKALLHAAFYGKSSAVVFDAVSLNISGDIYFNEGDLAKAVREYKRGLKCDNLDVNLHNSLGVALAMMNKLSPALQSFKNGLAIDTENFMALYNLGLGEQTRNRKSEALQYLEKALQYYNHEEGAGFVNDLRLQLGILSCELGKHEAALAWLVPWQLENNNAQDAGRVHYYLGKTHYGLKNNQKAMEALQRALRFNELDDRAMNLLGRVYLEEGEGNEIALSLCRKSVELEPSNLRYVLYLGEVLLHCGQYREARKNFCRCLKNRDCKMEAQQLLGESYAQEGQQRRAGSWFEKVTEQKKKPGNNVIGKA